MLLDFLFRRRRHDYDEEPESHVSSVDTGQDVEPHDISAFVSSRLNEKMPINILTDGDEVLFSGRIVKGSQSCLELGRLPGALSFKILDTGSTVTFMAYNVDLIKVRVRATVSESTATRLILKEWGLQETPAKRGAPRLPMNMQAKMYALEDVRMTEGHDCTITDLSLTGACITSTEELAVGDQFRLRFEVFKGDGANTCHAQVVWMKSTDGLNFTYGLLFAELDRWKRHNLEMSLEDLLRQLERKTAS